MEIGVFCSLFTKFILFSDVRLCTDKCKYVMLRNVFSRKYEDILLIEAEKKGRHLADYSISWFLLFW